MNIKRTTLFMMLILKIRHAMMFFVRCYLFFAVLPFVAITHYCASLRLAKKKQQRTPNTIQLRFIG